MNRPKFGRMEIVEPDKYVDIVNSMNERVAVVVHLYEAVCVFLKLVNLLQRLGNKYVPSGE